MGTLHEDVCTFMVISLSILLKMRNISDKNRKQNQNIHFVLNFLAKNRAICEIMWKCGRSGQATDDSIIRPNALHVL
jgi:hypothetical protein